MMIGHFMGDTSHADSAVSQCWHQWVVVRPVQQGQCSDGCIFCLISSAVAYYWYWILSYLIWNSLEYFSQGSLMMRMSRCAVCSPWSKGNMATQSRREERPRRPGIWNPANICFRFQNPRTARILPLLYGKLQRKASTSQERELL